MASIYDLKPKFQVLLRPVCSTLAKVGITANQVTLIALFLSAAAGLWLIIQPGSKLPLFLLPLVLFVRMALNAIDGMLAREFDMKSRLGAILNEMSDVISDAVLYLPFALHPDLDLWPVVVIVLLSIMNEMIGVVSIQIGGARRYDGPFGKSDRAFAFGLLAILLGLGWMNELTTNIILYLMIALSIVTLLNRGKKALMEIATT